MAWERERLQCSFSPQAQADAREVASTAYLGLSRSPLPQDSCMDRAVVQAISCISCTQLSQRSGCVKQVKHLQLQGTQSRSPVGLLLLLDCSLSQQDVGCTKLPQRLRLNTTCDLAPKQTR